MQKSLQSTMIFDQLVFSKYLLHSSHNSLSFFAVNLLNWHKTIPMKHVLHIHYLTTVDPKEEGYISRIKTLLAFRK